MGGARRDEEKARAKERFFSHRDEFGQWDPKTNALNCGTFSAARKITANIFACFPFPTGRRWTCGNIFISENIPIPKLYFSHEREVVNAMGSMISVSPWLQPSAKEEVCDAITGSFPHLRRHAHYRCCRIGCRHAWKKSLSKSLPPETRNAAHGRMTSEVRRRWRIGRSPDTFNSNLKSQIPDLKFQID